MSETWSVSSRCCLFVTGQMSLQRRQRPREGVIAFQATKLENGDPSLPVNYQGYVQPGVTKVEERLVRTKPTVEQPRACLLHRPVKLRGVRVCCMALRAPGSLVSLYSTPFFLLSFLPPAGPRLRAAKVPRSSGRQPEHPEAALPLTRPRLPRPSVRRV
jgi:hypothetical protein